MWGQCVGIAAPTASSRIAGIGPKRCSALQGGLLDLLHRPPPPLVSAPPPLHVQQSAVAEFDHPRRAVSGPPDPRLPRWWAQCQRQKSRWRLLRGGPLNSTALQCESSSAGPPQLWGCRSLQLCTRDGGHSASGSDF
eukprot:CAMPEP_0183449732 /NCGR_PEP_ID=MMETSP0370-20130417/110580_1 /TAXON_ID=268820 /ORGANISM="Peridinium aciculiferum, Strain PAER-2" /LENGTH=136 /DNA_ID=CAMNT_0025640837 /DNA_START=229 /DNA_END=640 /DNA_ORIENTATION=-